MNHKALARQTAATHGEDKVESSFCFADLEIVSSHPGFKSNVKRPLKGWSGKEEN